MSGLAMVMRTELIPPARQTLWGWPAVVNFVCGGLGAGFYAAAAVAAGTGGPAPLALASWLGPALVLAGFGAVAVEAGRPFRGARVLARIRTSWMSRELALGGVFAALAASGLVTGRSELRAAAAVSALALVLAQGLILRRAAGIAAWAVPVMPLVFLTSGMVSGVALLQLVEAVSGVTPPRLVGGVLVALVVHGIVWWTYLTWSHDATFAQGVRPVREGRGALAIIGGGVVGPVLLEALALALPALALPLVACGAALALASQVYLKAALILEAGQLRPITLGSRRSLPPRVLNRAAGRWPG